MKPKGDSGSNSSLSVDKLKADFAPATSVARIRRRANRDLWLIGSLAVLTYLFANVYNAHEYLEDWLLRHGFRTWELNELKFVTTVTGFAFAAFAMRRWLDLRREMAAHQHAEDVLHQRTGFLELQQVLATTANEATSVEEALQNALDIVCAYTGWSVGHVYFVQRGPPVQLVSSEIWRVADPNRFVPFQQWTRETTFAVGVGLPGLVLEKGGPVWMEDLNSVPAFRRADIAAQIGLRAGFAFPVWSGAEIVTVLEFFHDQPTAENTQLLAVMNYVGTQLGRVIERERAEQSLQDRERQFRALIENVSDNIVLLRADGTIVYESPAVERLLGYTPSELIGKNGFALVHPEDLPRVTKVLTRALGAEGYTATLECRLHHQDGTWRQFEVIGKNQLHDPVIAGIVLSCRDITERKRAEASLREAESKYRVLVEQSLVGVYLVVEHGTGYRFEYFNQAGAQIFGYAMDEIVGKLGPLELTEPDDHPVAQAALHARFHGETDEARYQFRGRHKEGTPVFCEVFGRRIDYLGQPAILGTLVDITERKHTEEQLHLQASALRAAANAIVITQSDGIVRWVNPAFTTLTGYTSKEVLGKNPSVLKSGTHSSEFYAQLWRTIAAGKVWRGELINRRKDGTLYTEDMTITPVSNDHGNVTHFIAIKQDITPHRQAAEALRTSEERYRGLFEAMREGFALCEIICDATGQPCDYRFLEVNAAFEEILGISRRDALRQTVRELFPQIESHWIKTYGTVALTGVPTHFENYLGPLKKFFEVAAFSPKSGQFAAIFMDITQRKQAEEELHQTNQRLGNALDELKNAEQQVIQQQRLRALGTMASGIAHDFNNSLAAILGFSELLLHRPENLADREKARRYLELINIAARDGSNIVSRLRQFYRHREDDEVLLPVDLNQLIQEAVSLTKPKWESEAQTRGVTIAVHTKLSSLPIIVGSAADLREMFMNLIFNAVDALPNGGTITLRTRCEADQIFTEVIDTGTGMTEEVRRRCLEPFFSTKGERGTGLGLSMVYGIIQRHAGTIDIRSAPGQGTTFLLRLPVPAKNTPTHPTPLAKPGTLRQLRVLLVDDEEQVRNVLTEFLTGDDHHVRAAGNGPEALAIFRTGTFDAVITDRAMPGMNGDQLALALKSIAPTVPVIMLTGFGAMMQAAGENPPGVDYIVSKPVTMNELRAALSVATERPARGS